MKKNIIILFILIVVVAGTIGYNLIKRNDTEDTSTLIKVSEVTRSVFYAPQYVAIQNGYFEEKGIEIELTTGQGAETPLP